MTPKIERSTVSAFTVPTDRPEADGTLEWRSTTIVVQIEAGGETGLGTVRPAIPVYGSGGFTSYSVAELTEQFSGWAAQGITRVKMKVGANPADDGMRVRAAREAIGDGIELRPHVLPPHGVGRLSSHTAPSVHAHLCCALPAARHAEYFHDHARIERIFFEGALQPVKGVLVPDATRPGLGLELRRADVAKYAS